MILEFNPAECYEAAQRIAGRRLPSFGWWAAIGLRLSGEIVAVVFYTQPDSDEDICMHIVAKPNAPWLRRGFVAAAFAYPFRQLVVRRVSAQAPEQNKPFQSVLKALGFVQEGIKRRAVGGRDYVSFGMLREECRYVWW